MAGNVNEWTRSKFVPYPGAPKDLRLKPGRRVIRGGAYRWPFRDARCAARDGAPEADYASAWIGFRVVIEVPASLPSLQPLRLCLSLPSLAMPSLMFWHLGVPSWLQPLKLASMSWRPPELKLCSC